MINSIIQLFRQQAREHKTIRSFYYNRNYEIGSGNESHPLLWLEDPITGRNQGNTFSTSVNFSILHIPTSEKEVAPFQNLAFSIGLNIIERIKHQPNTSVSVQPSWSFLTLRDYYDNNACGCRFSVDLIQLNMQNLCLINEQFDESKELDEENILNDFDIAPAQNCETFVNKLPVFDLKISKQ